MSFHIRKVFQKEENLVLKWIQIKKKEKKGKVNNYAKVNLTLLELKVE